MGKEWKRWAMATIDTLRSEVAYWQAAGRQAIKRADRAEAEIANRNAEAKAYTSAEEHGPADVPINALRCAQYVDSNSRSTGAERYLAAAVRSLVESLEEVSRQRNAAIVDIKEAVDARDAAIAAAAKAETERDAHRASLRSAVDIKDAAIEKAAAAERRAEAEAERYAEAAVEAALATLRPMLLGGLMPDETKPGAGFEWVFKQVHPLGLEVAARQRVERDRAAGDTAAAQEGEEIVADLRRQLDVAKQSAASLSAEVDRLRAKLQTEEAMVKRLEHRIAMAKDALSGYDED